jgi:hypothetical protein
MSWVLASVENGYRDIKRVIRDSQPREDVRFMKTMRNVALTLATAVLGVGALGITAPAHALDTNWPCAGCVKANPHP